LRNGVLIANGVVPVSLPTSVTLLLLLSLLLLPLQRIGSETLWHILACNWARRRPPTVTPTPLLLRIQRRVVHHGRRSHYSDRMATECVTLHGCLRCFHLLHMLFDNRVIAVLRGIATPNRKMNDGYFRYINKDQFLFLLLLPFARILIERVRK
jgi:hypothetical protein